MQLLTFMYYEFPFILMKTSKPKLPFYIYTYIKYCIEHRTKMNENKIILHKEKSHPSKFLLYECIHPQQSNSKLIPLDVNHSSSTKHPRKTMKTTERFFAKRSSRDNWRNPSVPKMSRWFFSRWPRLEKSGARETTRVSTLTEFSILWQTEGCRRGEDRARQTKINRREVY